MKFLQKAALSLMILCCFCIAAVAQTSGPVNDLIKQGVDLHNQGKYDDAIAKFNEALKIDPANGYANYEIAFSLYASKKPADAIPHLEQVIKLSNASLTVPAYSLLASIYDDAHQSQKAIDAYNEAININPDYPQIYFNLGIAYSRNQQYAEAEASAIEAIKHDPQNASSQRLYALVTFHQNKRANALLGFCSFLLLEPTGPRAAEAYDNIQHIMQGGALKTTTQNDKETGTLNLGITLAVQSGQAKKLTGLNLLEYELKTIFALTGQLAEKKTDKTFFDVFFAGYFYKLSQSNNMPAFTHAIAAPISAQWAKDNAQQVTDLAQWIKDTKRGF